MKGITPQNWRDIDINVDSLWLIKERDKSGRHTNMYHGNFIPQIPNQLIRRYTEEGDLVMELFSGSGTTLFECEKLKRLYIGFDINEDIISFVNGVMKDSDARYFLNLCDVTDKERVADYVSMELNVFERKAVDFLIAHPPYLDIVKFTEHEGDLSHITEVEPFIEKIVQAFDGALPFLKKGKYFSLVMGDVYKKSAVVPLAFYTMQALMQNFKIRLKGIVIKNIEGNRGKLGVQDIWKYRALKSDYFLFKHEYIFVFKKEF